MGRKKLRIPKQQGDQDGLCGIYAILNAVGYLYPDMSEDGQAKVFKTCMRFLTRWPEIIWDGTTTKDMRGMLNQFVDHNDNPESQRLIAVDRLHGNQGFGAFFDQLQTYVQPDSQVAIIGLEKPYEHWTVARELSGKRILLEDSNRLHFIARDDAGLPGSKKRWQIDPSSTFLIRRVND